MFQCSSASRKFLNPPLHKYCDLIDQQVSVLFSEPKIPQYPTRLRRSAPNAVSVLFSEPKIPQLIVHTGNGLMPMCFSALQRAENSSMASTGSRCNLGVWFQCSSASRKFLNSHALRDTKRLHCVSVLFSEPKIPQFAVMIRRGTLSRAFQCSSASRKFLNSVLWSMSVRCCN